MSNAESHSTANINNLPENDDITFIELAAILISHSTIFFFVFLVFFLSGLGYVFTMKETYQLNSVFEIGFYDMNSPIESAESVKLKLEQGLIPIEIESIVAKLKAKPTFIINISNPKDTLLIQLSSPVNDENISLHTKLHENTINQLISEHSILVKDRRASITLSLSQLQIEIDQQIKLKNNNSISILYDKKLSLRGTLISIEDTQIRVLGQRSSKPIGYNKKFVLFIVSIFSVLIAIFIALFVEFTKRVRVYSKS
jgi:uncharacterized protein involved in exopolysaccharide biosynthesis